MRWKVSRVLRAIVSLVAAVALVIGVPGLGSVGAASAAGTDFAQMRDRWVTYMLCSAPDMGDPDIASFVTSRSATAQNLLASMNTNAGRTSLWSDLSDFSTASVDSSIASSVDRLRSMAYAYRGAGSQLQGDASRRDAILGGLDWIITNYYKPGTAISGNWWNWEIGTPRRLGDLLVLMHDSVSVDLRQRAVAAIDAFCGDPTHRTQYSTTVEVGANRTDKALNVILRGIVSDDATKVAQGREAVEQVYPYVTSGDGIYEDGSFVFHGSIAHTGGYGPPLLESVGASWYLLSGTSWEVTSPQAANVYAWLDNAFIPLSYRGAMMYMVRGRKITRETETDHNAGQGVAGSIALFAASANQQRSQNYKRQVKAWMVADPGAKFIYGTSLYITQLLKAIRADSTISPTPDQSSAKVFNGMGRALQKGENFAVGISTFSDRLAAYTSLDGENLKGWWTGAGQTAIYAGDSKEFDQDYWATVDMTRLPGITTDGTASGTQAKFNTSSWAGGSTAGGEYGAMGMEFSMQNVTGTDVSGKKSWFMLGNKMVALGSALSATGTVETIVDNRLIPGTASDVKLGSAEVMNGAEGVTANASYGYLKGGDLDNSVGYVFVDSPSVKAISETRQGTWADVATYGSTAVKTNQFGSFAIQHGAGPTGGSYAYAVLPGSSEAQTQAAAADPGFEVLRNDDTAQSVSDGTTGVVAANFFKDEDASVPLWGSPIIKADKKASVTTRETATETTIGISDPTRHNQGQINVEFLRPAYGVMELDPGVTVTQLAPTVKLTVDTGKYPGKTA